MRWSRDEETGLLYQMVHVNPNDVRFTQRSIASHFSNEYERFTLEEAREKIQTGSMMASDFPPLQVCQDDNGTFWSKDNRRLWVFRMAGVTRAAVKLFRNMFFRMPPTGPQREEMSRRRYFPIVRGGGAGPR